MRQLLMLAVVFCLVFLAVGCDKPTPQQSQQITTAAVSIGFLGWATKNPDLETQVAKQVGLGATDALAYLTANQGVATTVLNATIQAKLTAGLPAELKTAIKSAAGLLDSVLPVPGPDTLLTGDQMEYLVAFVQGVKDACPAPGSKAMLMPKDIMDKAKKLMSREKKSIGGWL